VGRVEEYQVVDGKGNLHTFNVGLNEVLSLHFYYLDNKKIGVDDRYGWAYEPEGKQVKDRVLRDKLDEIVFGKVIPVGKDPEED
jgi:hypothetical protein